MVVSSPLPTLAAELPIDDIIAILERELRAAYHTRADISYLDAVDAVLAAARTINTSWPPFSCLSPEQREAYSALSLTLVALDAAFTPRTPTDHPAGTTFAPIASPL